ncbi:PREDICTED: uncharacterized protein LOC109471222 [Branchiostoma belcheri]|uniref:Uncharacterized protein LOC109471222 n=1 Tax=Branchiostoma belcheri TaxID=7741 RepID=A0A6P4YAJ4_BRABE|nr:PREDICTED: uncharacterized protein LOC109471222 [Branchiostoma belcheri]
MKRWLVQYGISVESEKESRRIAGELLSPHGVVSELLPFTAKDGDNCLTVKLLPAASVQCLSGTIEAHVRQLEAAGRLTCMTLEPEDRELILRKRTLERLDMHYRQFQEEGGGNISKAKLYKNVIAPYMFNVPLDQVCVPGLHVSLGIYHRLYTMMEAELQDLDRVIGAYMVRVVDDEDMDEGEVLYHHQLHGLKPYVEAMQEARAVDNMVEDLSEELEELESSLAYAILQARSLDNIMSMKEEIERLMERKRKLESESEDIKTGTKSPVPMALSQASWTPFSRTTMPGGRPTMVGDLLGITWRSC